MYLKRLELKGYKLLHLSGIKKILIDFDRDFHWILGTNGSGKTSIIKESTPLPGEREHYEVGGYKEALWILGNKQYKLRSDFEERRSKHSLKVLEGDTWIELNEGYTSKVFKDKVLEIFKWDREAYLVSTGQLRLSEMDPGARKALFTSLSTVSYEYAIAYYKRLYAYYRDIQGSLRQHQAHYTDLKSSLNIELEQKYLEDLKQLKDQARQIAELKPQVPLGDPLSQIYKLDQEAESLMDKVLDRLREYKDIKRIDSQEAYQALGRVEQRLQLNKESCDKLYQQHRSITKELETLNLGLAEDRKQLEQQYQALFLELSNLQYKYLKKDTDPLTALDRFRDLQIALNEVISEMRIYPAEETATLDKLLLDAKQLQDTSQGVEARIATLIEHTKHLETTGPEMVSCPQCQHTFDAKDTQTKLASLKLSLETLYQQRTQVVEKLEALEKRIHVLEHFEKGLRIFQQLVYQYPEMNDFWSVVIQERIHRTAPIELTERLRDYHQELLIKVQSQEKYKLLETLKEQLRIDRALRSSKIESLKQSLKEIEDQANEQMELQVELHREKEVIQKQIKLHEFLKALHQKALQLKKDLEHHWTWYHQTLERDAYNELLLKIDTAIATKEKDLQTMMNKSHELKVLERRIASQEVELEYLKKSLKALSPAEGLIAEGLTGFINTFTEQMNRILRRIMTYKFEFIPLKLEEDKFELDYTLPMQVEEASIKDIRDCSRGQKEVIDLAFMLVYLVSRGLDKSPIRLDEFGSHLDHRHRHEAFKTIMSIKENTNFSQVLIVSHITETMQLLADSGLTLLCQENVDIPASALANRTSTIER